MGNSVLLILCSTALLLLSCSVPQDEEMVATAVSATFEAATIEAAAEVGVTRAVASESEKDVSLPLPETPEPIEDEGDLAFTEIAAEDAPADVITEPNEVVPDVTGADTAIAVDIPIWVMDEGPTADPEDDCIGFTTVSPSVGTNVYHYTDFLGKCTEPAPFAVQSGMAMGFMTREELESINAILTIPAEPGLERSVQSYDNCTELNGQIGCGMIGSIRPYDEAAINAIKAYLTEQGTDIQFHGISYVTPFPLERMATLGLHCDYLPNEEYQSHSNFFVDMTLCYVPMPRQGLEIAIEEKPPIPAGEIACGLAEGDVVTISNVLSTMGLLPDPRIPCTGRASRYWCEATTKTSANVSADDAATYLEGSTLIVQGEARRGPVLGSVDGWWWPVSSPGSEMFSWLRQEFIYGCEPGSELRASRPPELNRLDAYDCVVGEDAAVECSVGYRSIPFEVRYTDEGFSPQFLDAPSDTIVFVRNVTDHPVAIEFVSGAAMANQAMTSQIVELSPGELFFVTRRGLTLREVESLEAGFIN